MSQLKITETTWSLPDWFQHYLTDTGNYDLAYQAARRVWLDLHNAEGYEPTFG